MKSEIEFIIIVQSIKHILDNNEIMQKKKKNFYIHVLKQLIMDGK